MPSADGTYWLGETARISATFRDNAGELVDPSAVQGLWKAGEAENVVTATRISTGRYYFDVPCQQTGWHNYRIVGSGGHAAGAESGFSVRPATPAEPLS